MEKGLLTISSLNMQYLVVLFCEVGLRCIMPIESSSKTGGLYGRGTKKNNT